MAYPRFQLARNFKWDMRTAGNISLNSTSWAAVPTLGTFTLACQVGDVIRFAITSFADSAAVELYFDVATIVSAVPANYFSTATATPATAGIAGWGVPASVDVPITGEAFYAVQAGDIVSGAVTFQQYYKSSTGTSRSLRADSARTLQRICQNLGQPDPN